MQWYTLLGRLSHFHTPLLLPPKHRHDDPTKHAPPNNAGKKGTCEDVILRDARDILRGAGGSPCKFLFRGHVNLFDYRGALQVWPVHSYRPPGAVLEQYTATA